MCIVNVECMNVDIHFSLAGGSNLEYIISKSALLS